MEDFMTGLRRTVSEAEAFRRQILGDLGPLDPGETAVFHADRRPGLVLDLTMFYGRAFRSLLDLPWADAPDELWAAVFEEASCGSFVFRAWRTRRTSLEWPDDLTALSGHWRRVLDGCCAAPAGEGGGADGSRDGGGEL